MPFLKTSANYYPISLITRASICTQRILGGQMPRWLTVGIPGFTGNLYFLCSFLGLRFSGMHLCRFYNEKSAKFSLLAVRPAAGCGLGAAARRGAARGQHWPQDRAADRALPAAAGRWREAARCDPATWMSGFRGQARMRVEEAARKTTPRLRQAGVMPWLGPGRQKWVRLRGVIAPSRSNPGGGWRWGAEQNSVPWGPSALPHRPVTPGRPEEVLPSTVRKVRGRARSWRCQQTWGRGQVVSAPQRREGAWPPSPKPGPSEGCVPGRNRGPTQLRHPLFATWDKARSPL